jgi:hypothetical protein
MTAGGRGVASSPSAAAVPALANRPRLPTPSAKPPAARNFFVVLGLRFARGKTIGHNA